MRKQVAGAGPAVLLAFLLAPLAGKAVAADKPAVPPPPPAFEAAPPVSPKDRTAAEPRQHKLRLRVPFTPVNEDGSPGKRTLITITVEGDDRDQALEAADQVIDRLIVRPAVDEVWDEIDQHIQDAIRSGGIPSILPPPIPAPGATSRQVKDGQVDMPPPAPVEATSGPECVRSGVEITPEGLLESLDGAAAVLGVPSLFSLLSHSGSDPNQRMDVLLNQSEHIGQIGAEWKKTWDNLPPSHMTYERVHGGNGP